MEHERLRREKLEVQLDHTRQELEKAVKSLRDYETKVSFENYLVTQTHGHSKYISEFDMKGGLVGKIHSAHIEN